MIGRLGRDPVVTEVAGARRAAISIAINESYRNTEGERVTNTQWHQVVAWGKLADLAEKHLIKGIEIIVQGKLLSKVYTDQHGVRRYACEIQAGEILVLSKGKHDAG